MNVAWLTAAGRITERRKRTGELLYALSYADATSDRPKIRDQPQYA